jgi:hypothetical protein
MKDIEKSLRYTDMNTGEVVNEKKFFVDSQLPSWVIGKFNDKEKELS